MKKETILISFSGGETSAYMMYYLLFLWDKRKDYDFVVVFANTGEEDENTLVFVKDFCEYYNIDCIWLEAVINDYNVGTSYNIVDFETASRNGEPFEAMITKYGIPNHAFKHCNRELKLNPIHSFMKNGMQLESYYTAIGIRYDEIDRMAKEYKEKKILYPLITEIKMTKQKINFWFSQQPFRLNLTGYQGNCKTCWKKGDLKLYQIAREAPERFNNFKIWEEKYGYFYPENQEKRIGRQVFFRGHRSVDDILKESKIITKKSQR